MARTRVALGGGSRAQVFSHEGNHTVRLLRRDNQTLRKEIFISRAGKRVTSGTARRDGTLRRTRVTEVIVPAGAPTSVTLETSRRTTRLRADGSEKNNGESLSRISARPSVLRRWGE